MSIQLADLYTTYVVFARNAQTAHAKIFQIAYNFEYKVWYLATKKGSMFCDLNEPNPPPLPANKEWQKYFFNPEKLKANKYETAEQALAVLQAWADKFGYTLSAHS